MCSKKEATFRKIAGVSGKVAEVRGGEVDGLDSAEP
jgi:hypothetical protein